LASFLDWDTIKERLIGSRSELLAQEGKQPVNRTGFSDVTGHEAGYIYTDKQSLCS